MQEIAEFLKTLHFNTEKITQEWRHVTAFGKFEGKEAVFKLASTQSVSFYTQKEYLWNDIVHANPDSVRQHFTVPQNFSSGKFGTLFYFVAQKFPGTPLAKAMTPLQPTVKKFVTMIAQATREIQLLSIPNDSQFALHKKASTGLSAGEKLLQSSTEWASQVPVDLTPFLQVIEKAKLGIRSSPAHGDFVLRQMYDVEGKIGIIDGEHAGAKGSLYYDVAQFYLRTRVDHQALEFVHSYLSTFFNLLSKPDQDMFWDELKPVLIQRYIGDLWGAAKQLEKLKSLEPLGKEILEDKIFKT